MIVRVRAIGPLAEALGGGRTAVEVEEGTVVGALLDRLVRAHPRAAPFLGASGNRRVAVFRTSRRLGELEALAPEDEVHLVLTVAGG